MDRTDDEFSRVSYYKQRTPTDLRALDPEKAAQIESTTRPPHDQTVTPDDRLVTRFNHCQFVAHLDREMKYGSQGDLIVTFAVPYEFKHLAQPLADAFGMLMSVDVQLWRPYAESLEEG